MLDNCVQVGQYRLALRVNITAADSNGTLQGESQPHMCCRTGSDLDRVLNAHAYSHSASLKGATLVCIHALEKMIDQ
jgi:hypothetical protein